ncbi:Syntaxin-52 [Rhynchospora pubera]|uniref:Syntaxin-52 n=1 Tax=Rhynchospora pubera TaxID=906938 RepID=A0AAV8F4Z8_9POAL|nr:Syntaxin-52 [Rhynchospora pubera]
MASPADLWVKEYGEASRLADEVSKMLSERGSLPPSGPETQRFLSGLRRRITILGTRLGKLEADLASLPRKSISDKEMHKRHELLSNLRAREKQMASALNMSYAADREDLLGSSKGTVDEVKRAAGLDNQGIVGLQRQIMREQDEGLEKLEETVYSTKHIALAVNEELNLHTRLIDTLDQRVEDTDSRLQRVQKRLAILNKRNKAGCSCMCLVLSVLAIVILAVIAWMLLKYL